MTFNNLRLSEKIGLMIGVAIICLVSAPGPGAPFLDCLKGPIGLPVYASGGVISEKRAEWFAEPWRAAGFTFPCKSAEQSCARSQVTQR